jgi:hypothetical protein
MKKQIKVLFLLETCIDTKATGEVFAYFPDEVHNGSFKTAYAHTGQHSPCHPEYAAECKEANYNEYQYLLKELLSIGYKNLQIQNKQKIELHRRPTEMELKFGHGATHYRTFKLSELVNNRGSLKKWIRAKDDGLRYYR